MITILIEKEQRMASEMITTDIGFPSADGKSTIHGIIWQPAGRKPIAIVQIIHGMAEHIGRYEPFARYLVKQGFLVCGHDHIGHGYSSATEDLGHMPAKNGSEILVEDSHSMRSIISGIFPDVPYFMFGHSMGSYTLRVYLTEYGSDLAGAVICGTGWIPQAVSVVGSRIAKGLAKAKGERGKSDLVRSMVTGVFSKAVDDPRTEFDWISVNEDNVDDFMEDELSGFDFTLGGYISLIRIAGMASKLELAKKIPHDLPLLFIAGSEDPVGANGRGVAEAVRLVKRAGAKNVKVVLYGGMRHEILNEKENDKVFADVLDWMQAIVSDRQ